MERNHAPSDIVSIQVFVEFDISLPGLYVCINIPSTTSAMFHIKQKSSCVLKRKYSAWKAFKKCCFHPSLRPSQSGGQQISDSGTKKLLDENSHRFLKKHREKSVVLFYCSLYIVMYICNSMHTVIIFVQSDRCILANQAEKSPPEKKMCSNSGPMEGDTKWHRHRQGTPKKGVSIWVTKFTSGKSLENHGTKRYIIYH